jgi:hypothetical protein
MGRQRDGEAVRAMPSFIEFVTQGRLFDSLADCPRYFTTPNAPQKRDVIGPIFLSVLAGRSVMRT